MISNILLFIFTWIIVGLSSILITHLFEKTPIDTRAIIWSSVFGFFTPLIIIASLFFPDDF